MKTNSTALRNELIQVTQTWASDGRPEKISDVFYLASHMNALALDRPLVIGMRGAGKSFWSDVLCNADLRSVLTNKIHGYESLRSVHSIRWDQANGFSSDLPEASTLTEALLAGTPPRLLWLSLFLSKFQSECKQLGITTGIPDHEQGWRDVFRWANSNPDALRSGLAKLEKALQAQGQSVLLVIDGLDRMAGQLTQGVECLRGLLEVLLESRSLKGLRFKAFLREDMTNLSSVLSFPDASKLLNEAPRLSWSREEIYALHLHKLAQKSPTFQILLENKFNKPKQKSPSYWHPVLAEFPPTVKQHAERLTEILKLLAPPYMGKAPNKGHVYSWWHKHLADGKARVSPRTFSAALKAALRASEGTAGAMEFALTPKGIQQGLREASSERIAELKEDYFWIETALAAFNDRSTPVSVKEIYGVWSGNRVNEGQQQKPVPQIIREICAGKKVFVPWDDANFTISPSQNLRDTLVELGILTLRDEGTRLDMPDIYRLGYKIRKRGGVSPRR